MVRTDDVLHFVVILSLLVTIDLYYKCYSRSWNFRTERERERGGGSMWCFL